MLRYLLYKIFIKFNILSLVIYRQIIGRMTVKNIYIFIYWQYYIYIIYKWNARIEEKKMYADIIMFGFSVNDFRNMKTICTF